MPITQLITPKWIKERHILGVSTTDDFGDEFPDSQYFDAIDGAIAYYESLLGVPIRSQVNKTFTDRIDSKSFSSTSYWLCHTRYRPVTEIVSVGFRFMNHPKFSIPVSWVEIAVPRTGQLRILPSAEWMTSQNGMIPFTLWTGNIGSAYVPGILEIEYRAGFERRLSGTVSAVLNDDHLVYTPSGPSDASITSVMEGEHLMVGRRNYFRVEEVDGFNIYVSGDITEAITNQQAIHMFYDPLLLKCIGKRAAIPVLQTAGDLILGAGIASMSISQDGQSQSISSTSGVENSGYGARIAEYRKALEADDAILEANFRRRMMLVI